MENIQTFNNVKALLVKFSLFLKYLFFVHGRLQINPSSSMMFFKIKKNLLYQRLFLLSRFWDGCSSVENIKKQTVYFLNFTCQIKSIKSMCGLNLYFLS